MPEPIAVCIEDIDAPSDDARFLQCVAIAGGSPGLRVDSRGEVLWKCDDDVACEIWVSADDKLMLFRPTGAPEVTLHRGGRSLDLPFEKPVVTIDGDSLDVADRHFRLHVHGAAGPVSPPQIFVPKTPQRTGLLKAAAAAAVLGGALVGGAGCEDAEPIDVRSAPPKVAPPKKPTGPKEQGESGESEKAEKEKPIEVREHPPIVVE